MIAYNFLSNLKENEISRIISERTTPLKLVSLFKMDSFIGEVNNRKITIGRTPDFYRISNISFFCGRIVPNANGVNITGHFGAPIKFMIYPYAAICIFSLLYGKLFGLFAGTVACYLFHVMQALLLSINTQSKRDIIEFIKMDLNCEMLSRG